MEARRDKNYYFDIFKGYKNMLAENQVMELLAGDFAAWEVPYMQQL